MSIQSVVRVGAVIVVCVRAIAPARGAITITTSPVSGPTFTLTPVSGKTRVVLNTSVTSAPTTFQVRGAAGDQIESLVINASVNQMVFVEIRGNSAGTPIASVDSIDLGTSTATVVLSDVRTTGNVGSIRVNTISNMNVGGDVTGGITLTPRMSGESTIINGTVSGRILGDVLVDNGAIFGLTVTNGLGIAAEPVIVRTKGNIVRLSARDIYADINTLSNGGFGIVGKIETTGGPFAGSLTTAAIGSTGVGEPGVLSIAGDLDANVSVLGPVKNENGGLPVVSVSGRFMAGRVFRIASSLMAGAPMRFNTAGGLLGQVIINATNGAGVWAGSVMVGGGTLGPVPEYSAVSASVGGGAVGVPPFVLHGGDSWPARGSVLATADSPRPLSPIRLKHYGPVNWSGSAPVIVESRAIGSSGAWMDITPCFSIAREPGATPSANVVAAYPIRAMTGGKVYRVRPVRTGAGALLCDLGLVTNPAVAEYANEYSFTVTGACGGDADGNGVVNFADISALLAGWGSSPGGCFSTLDVTADGVVNFADITAVLSAWGC